MDGVEYFAGLFPSVAVFSIFVFVIRAMLHADRRERAAMAALDRLEAQQNDEDVRRGTGVSSPSGPATPPST